MSDLKTITEQTEVYGDEYCSICEATSMLNISEGKVRSLVKQGVLKEAKREGIKIFLYKRDIKNFSIIEIDEILINKRKELFRSDIILNENWYTVTETANMVYHGYDFVNDKCKNGEIKYEMINNKLLICHDEVLKLYLLIKFCLFDAYTIKEACDLLQTNKYYLDKLITLGVIEKVERYCGSLYLAKSTIDNIYKILQENPDTDIFKMNLLLKDAVLNREWYPISAITNALGYSKVKLIKMCKEGLLYYQKVNDYLIHRDSFEFLIKEEQRSISEGYTVKQIANLLNKTMNAVEIMLSQGKFKCSWIIKGKYYISKEEVESKKELYSRSGKITEYRKIGLADKEWYTFSEVAILTGFTKNMIKRRCNVVENELKATIHKYLINRCDVIALQKIRDFCINDSYTVADASKIIGFCEEEVKRLVSSEVFKKTERYNGRLYLSKIEVDNFSVIKTLEPNSISSLKQYKVDLGKEWFQIAEVSQITGYACSSLREKCIKKDLIFKKEKNTFYIHLKGIVQLISNMQFCLQESYSVAEAAKILCKTPEAINIMINRGQLKNVMKYKTQSYIAIEEINQIVEKELELKNDYLSLEAAKKLMKLSKDTLLRCIGENKIEAKKYKLPGENYRFYISKNVVEEYSLKTSDTMLASELADKLKVTRSTIYKKIKLECFPKAFNDLYIGQYRIPVSNIHEYLKSENGLELITKGRLDEYEIFELYMDAVSENNKQGTYKLYREWGYERLKNSSADNKRSSARSYGRVLFQMLKHITREIYDYNDIEINWLIRNLNLCPKEIELVILFMNYTKHTMGDNCKFKTTYTVNDICKRAENSEDEVYSPEIFLSYKNELMDINRHLPKAINNSKYARTWLYTVLHLSIAWRHRDIVRMPNLDLSFVGICNLFWFEENDFTIAHAQAIINQVKDRLLGLPTMKTSSRTHFVIDLELLVPTALAFSICEIHRTIEGREFLFANTACGKEKFRKHDYTKLFTNKELLCFENLKFNRSLMRYQYDTAVNKEGRVTIAYSLASYLRSHKGGRYIEISPMTRTYLESTQVSTAQDVVWNLFKRGTFGWQARLMLQIAYDTKPWNLDEMTNQILRVNNEYTSISVDLVSDCLNKHYENVRELTNELIRMDRVDIRTSIIDISQGKKPGLSEDTNCIIGIENCTYKRRKSCFGCKYAIYINYVLSSIKVRITDLVERLSETNIDDSTKREKFTYLIFQMLIILQEADKEFSLYNKDYIKSFINIDELESSLLHLESNKYLIY